MGLNQALGSRYFQLYIARLFAQHQATFVMRNTAFFGLNTFQFFSVAAADAHDFANTD